MNKLIVIALSLIVTSCATQYKAPIKSATATLEIESNIENVFVQNFRNEECGESPNGTRLAFLTSKNLTGVKKQIEANGQFVISFKRAHLNAYTSGWECTSTAVFKPIADETYRAMYQFKDNKCGLVILRREMKNQREVFVKDSSFRKAKKSCFKG